MFIVDALRTPRGRGNAKGKLAGLEPVQLLAHVARALLDKHRIDPSMLDEALIGCVGQTGPQGSNVGRAALLEAGYGDACGAVTLNRFCTSSLTATVLSALRAAANDSISIAGGVEMLSKVALGADQGPLSTDLALLPRQSLLPIGICADVIATREGFSREQCDAWAQVSQSRAARARERGSFPSLVPIPGVLELDETPRPETTATSLAQLDPAFVKVGAAGFDDVAKTYFSLPEIRHVHTVASAPATADAASIVLVASDRAVQRHKLAARARLVGQVEVAGDRVLGLDGTSVATRRVLAKTNLRADQLDVVEVNEAYAAPTLKFIRDFALDPAKVNANGGAIALGHPMGATGGILISTALDRLEAAQGRYALVTVAGATGLATALVLERA